MGGVAIACDSVSLAVAIASLIASVAAALIARSALSQVEQVAERVRRTGSSGNGLTCISRLPRVTTSLTISRRRTAVRGNLPGERMSGSRTGTNSCSRSGKHTPGPSSSRGPEDAVPT
jgi:uncharacterized membrane protein YgcG